MLLQESNQLNGIKMLTSDFLNIFHSYSQFPGSLMPVLYPLQTLVPPCRRSRK